jgi:hypothetical protein
MAFFFTPSQPSRPAGGRAAERSSLTRFSLANPFAHSQPPDGRQQSRRDIVAQ